MREAHHRTHIPKASVSLWLPLAGVVGNSTPAMEDSQLAERVEGFATRSVNEDSLFGDRRHDTVVDEVNDELSRGHLVDIPRRDSGCFPVLCEELISSRS